MIVLDTSALVAMLFAEPEAESFAKAIADAEQAYVGAPTAFEFMMVAKGRSTDAILGAASQLINNASVQVLPWTSEHATLALDAFGRFGMGQQSAAKLNFGDCMAYAVAKALGAPLLYKGRDFVETDIRSAI